MKKQIIIVSIIAAALLFTSPALRFQQDKRDIQAIVVKVINDVTRKSPTSGWQKAIRLDRLRSGHQIRTDAGSLALIRFADETKLIVRSKSIVEIKGQVEGRRITDRSIHIDRGNVGFNVRKQQTEQFRFSSPISVASIRGTIGEFESLPARQGGGQGDLQDNEERNDRLTIFEGLANLLNLVSNQSQDVGSNQTGESNSNGQLNVRPATPGEMNSAGSAGGTGDEGLGEEGEGGGEGTGGQGTQPAKKREIRIEVEDQSGNKREVIIEWQ